MPEAFGIKSGKSPNFGRIKAKKSDKLFTCAKRLRSGSRPLENTNLLIMTGLNEEYRQHRVFAQLAKYQEFYKDLADLVFNCMTQGTHSLCNIDTYVYSSMSGTLESIHQVLHNGRINDGYSLLRKFYDSTVINIYTNLYLDDHFTIENFIVEKIDGWLKGKEAMPSFDKMSKYILSSAKLEDITVMLFDSKQYAGSALSKIRKRCNSHTHYLYFQNVLSNDNEIHLPARLTYLNNFSKDLEAIFIMHLAYLFYLNDHYMRSPDYVDSIEFGLTPEEGSEYYVSPFIQDLFNEVIKANRPDLAAAIKKKTMMQLD
jgi:hypothetical protein